MVGTLTSEPKKIIEYIAQDDPAAAQRLTDTIVDSTVSTLSAHPSAGRAGRVMKTREWVAHKNYIVVYRIECDEVKIIAVRRTSRMWPQRF